MFGANLFPSGLLDFNRILENIPYYLLRPGGHDVVSRGIKKGAGVCH